MKLSIIIVNWNSAAVLRDCLDSLVQHCELGDTEVLVVDNGSFDGSKHLVTSHFPWVHFVQLACNVGFARANNIAATQARGRHLLFLNPDTLLHGDTPSVLLHHLAAQPRAAAAGCHVLNRDGSTQTSCVQSFPGVLNQALDSHWLRERFPESRLWGTAALQARPGELRRVEAVTGACLAVRRDAFDEVGGFSEDYFMFGEDLDLCRKFHRAGWEILYTPDTSIVHLGGASTGQAPGDFSILMMRESVHRFIALHDGRAAAAAYRVVMGLSAVLRLALLVAPALVPHGPDSRRKWRAVLRWSTGLDRPVPARTPRPSHAAHSTFATT